MVACNDKGEVIHVNSKVSILEVAEIAILWHVMNLAYHQGWNRVIFKIDAQSVVKALYMKDRCILHWASKIFFCNIIMYSHKFDQVKFLWAPRSANSLAHLVCKWGATHLIVGPVLLNWLPPSLLKCMTHEGVPMEAN